MQVYQLADLQWIAHPEKNRLLATSYVDIGVSGWEIVQIRPAMIDWTSGQAANYGLVVVVTSLSGHPADGRHLFEHAASSNKQPILVVFSRNTRPDPHEGNGEEGAGEEEGEEVEARSSPLGQSY